MSAPAFPSIKNSTPTLKSLLWQHAPTYAAGAVVLACGNLLALGIPWGIKLAIDEIIGNGTHASLQFVNQCAMFILMLACGYALLRILSREILFGAGRDIEAELRQRVYDHAQALDAAFFDKTPGGQLVSLITNDTNVVRLLFGMGLLNLLNGTLLYLLSAVLMFSLNPRLAIWAMIPYLLILLILKRLAPGLHVQSRKVQEEIAGLTEFVRENLSGQEVLRAFHAQFSEQQRFLNISASYLQASMALTKIRGMLFTSTGAIGGMGSLFLLWVGGGQVIRGEISLGDFIAFSGFLTLLVMPTLMFGFVMSVWQRGQASLERISEFLNIAPSIQDPEKPRDTVPRQKIQVKNLTFAFPASKAPNALNRATFDIPIGKVTALVGPIGSGKSTLASIFPRIYPIPPGSITLDDTDANECSTAHLRGLFSLAPQSPFLFSMTVGENIGFGDEREIERAANLAQVGLAHGELPLTLSTRVGEKGVLLSGGQKQRIAIARAIAYPAPILILDDPFASLDADTAIKILHGLRNQEKDRTILLITHKVSLVREADHIVVLEDGGVVGQGGHAELLKTCRAFQDLYAQERLTDEA